MNEDGQDVSANVDEVDTSAPVAEEADNVSTEPDTAEQAEQAEDAGSQDQETATSQDKSQSDSQANQDTARSSTWDSYIPRGAKPNEVKPDENGYIDPIAYKEAIKAEMREEAQFERSETQAWSKLEEAYPEIKEDPELRELIMARRISDVQKGGDGGLIANGEAVMRKFGSARNAGKADAQVSVKKQKAAGTARATAPRDTSQSNVEQRIRSGDPEAIAGVLSGWIDEGKI